MSAETAVAAFLVQSATLRARDDPVVPMSLKDMQTETANNTIRCGLRFCPQAIRAGDHGEEQHQQTGTCHHHDHKFSEC
jgi:hypothetical protein